MDRISKIIIDGKIVWTSENPTIIKKNLLPVVTAEKSNSIRYKLFKTISACTYFIATNSETEPIVPIGNRDHQLGIGNINFSIKEGKIIIIIGNNDEIGLHLHEQVAEKLKHISDLGQIITLDYHDWLVFALSKVAEQLQRNVTF